MRGLLVIALGMVALVWPDVTVKVVAVLVGILVAIFGISTIAHALERRRAELSWVGTLLGGLVATGGGLAAIFWPGPTVVVLARLFGALLLVSGILGVLDVFTAGGDDPAKMPLAAVSGLAVVAGGVLLVWPDITIGVIVVIQGIFWIVSGVLSIFASRQVRHGELI